MLDDRFMRALLGESRSIAIVGAKDAPGQPVAALYKAGAPDGLPGVRT